MYFNAKMEITPVIHDEDVGSQNEVVYELHEEGGKKRKRKFLHKWIETYPWIDYNESDGMYCKVCRDFCEEYEDKDKCNSMIVGSKNFQLSTIKRHEISKLHKKYCPNDEPMLKMPKYSFKNSMNLNEHQVLPNSTPSDSKKQSVRAYIVKLDSRPNMRLENIFRTVYYVEKLNLPHSQYPGICKLQQANGTDLGNQYISHPSVVSEMSKYIGLSFKHEVINSLNESEYFGIILDSYLDADVIVSVTTLNNGAKETRYIGLIKSGTPTEIIKNLELFFEGINVYTPFQKMCALTTDGTSTYLGNNDELSQLFQRKCPYLISIHCLAHKLQVLVKGNLNEKQINTNCLNRLFKVVGKLFSFYLKSTLLMDKLNVISEALKKDVAKFDTIPRFQWPMHLHQSFNILLKNWTLIVKHLENINEQEPESELREKAAKLLRLLKDISFLSSLAFYSDFYKLLGKTSDRLRSNELLAHDALIELEVLSQQLIGLGKHGGGTIRNITNELECGSFQGVKLSFEKNNTQELLKEGAVVAREVAKNISSIMRNSSKEIYKLNILDPRHWPEADLDSKMWQEFGVEEIQTLEPCVKSLIPDYDEILVQEWQTFKHTTFHSFPAITKACLQSLSQHFFKVFNDSFRFRGIRCLLYLMQLVSPNSETAEKAFNIMNEVKLKSNQETNLDTALTITQLGPDIEKFEPAEALDLWFKDKRHQQPQIPNANAQFLQLHDEGEENVIACNNIDELLKYANHNYQ